MRRRAIAAVAGGLLVAGLAVTGLAAADPASAAATTVYVATSGTDSATCGTSDAPCKTIQRGVDNASTGDTVSVAAGTYPEVVFIAKGITLQGAGSGNTVIDGQGLDQTRNEAGGRAYGVIFVGTASGTAAIGDVTVDGFTIENPSPFAGSDGTPETVALRDLSSADHITISNNVIKGPASDPNAATDGPIGIDSFVNAAATTIQNNNVSGAFQGMLLEDNGPATVSSNNVHDLIGYTAGGTQYPAEGVYLLSDVAGAQNGQIITNNGFSGYAGIGIAMSAGYDTGNCATTPCNGSIDATATGNTFALGSAGNASAFRLRATESGNALNVALGGNTGTVSAPTATITSDPGLGTINLTSTGTPDTITPQPAPTLDIATPATLQPGADYTSFDGTASNPTGGDSLAHVRYDVALKSTSGVSADQVDLEYQVNGTWLQVPLTGTTANGGSISGYFGPPAGFAFPAGVTNSTNFRIKIAPGAPLGPVTSTVSLDEVAQSGSNPAINTVASDTGTINVTSPEKPTLTLSSATPGNLHAVVQTNPVESGVVVHLYTLDSSGAIKGYVAKATTNSAGKAHYTFHGVKPGKSYTLEAKVFSSTPYTEEFSDPATATVKKRTVEKPDLTTSSAATHHLHLVAQTDPAEANVVVHFYTATASGHVVNYLGHDTTNSSGSAHLTLTNAAHGKTYKIVARVVTHTQYEEVYSDVVWQPVH